MSMCGCNKRGFIIEQAFTFLSVPYENLSYDFRILHSDTNDFYVLLSHSFLEHDSTYGKELLVQHEGE